MRAKTWILAGAVLAAVAGGALLLDALVTTDEERLERFVETVTGRVGPDTLQEGLSWVDPHAQPLEVQARGMGKLYDARNADDLQPDAREALQPYMGDTVRSLREAIEVDGDRGTVELRLLTRRGMVDASFRFQRRQGRWLLARARVR